MWWGEDPPTRLVWITLLVASDHEGVYRGTLPGLAGRARVTLEEARLAVHRLQQPDSESRSPEYEGRRIEVLPEVGFRLLNYRKYRDKRSPIQEADAQRKLDARRARSATDKTDMSRTNPPDLRSEILDLRSEISDPRVQIGEGESEREAPPSAPPAAVAAPTRASRTKKPKTPLPEDFTPNASCLTLAKDRGVDLSEQLPAFIDHHTKVDSRFADWQAAMRTWLRDPRCARGATRARQTGTSRNSSALDYAFDIANGRKQ